MSLEIRVDDDEVQEYLETARDELNLVMDEQVVQAANEVRDGARRRAPKRSGRLAAGYKVDVDRKGPGQTTARVTNDVPYAEGAEFGERGKWKGFRRYGDRANRFIFPARSRVIASLTSRLLEAVDDVLE